MIRKKYKKISIEKLEHITEGKEMLLEFIKHVKSTAPPSNLTVEQYAEWDECRLETIKKITEAGFWFTQMETT